MRGKATEPDQLPIFEGDLRHPFGHPDAFKPGRLHYRDVQGKTERLVERCKHLESQRNIFRGRWPEIISRRVCSANEGIVLRYMDDSELPRTPADFTHRSIMRRGSSNAIFNDNSGSNATHYMPRALIFGMFAASAGALPIRNSVL